MTSRNFHGRYYFLGILYRSYTPYPEAQINQ